jgi:molecular chaperone GrpE
MTKDNSKDWGKVREEMEADLENESSMTESSIDEEAPNALAHPEYAELEQQLTLAEQKAHENWEKSVRALAEVENIRRRTEREVANAHRYALEKFATSLLPVMDSLEQALQLASQHGDDAMREGLELTIKLMIDTLEKHGVKQIDPIGEVFNPQLHEAMSMQPSDSAEPNTVLTVFQKGYLLNDRMIRPARVIVAKG